MSAAACLTLAVINFLFWCRNRKAWTNLLFFLTATSTAAWAFCELWMMRADTPAEFAAVLKWAHIVVWLLVVSNVWFVRFYLKAGHLWLAWTVCGLRTLALLLNFLTGQNLNYREITRLDHVRLFGESVAIAEGVPNPWMLVGHLSLVAWLIFTADASANCLGAGRPPSRARRRKYCVLRACILHSGPVGVLGNRPRANFGELIFHGHGRRDGLRVGQ
jgi:hypothetical protein